MMTLAEYKAACSAETIATAFMDKSNLQTLDPVLWTDLLLTQLETVIPVVRGDLEVSGSDEIDDVTDLNALVLKRSNAIVYMHGDEWALRLKAMTALAGLSASDLGDTWSRARTASGRKDGGTTTDGTAKRNSFNTSELVPVSGSHVEATSGEMYSDTVTETGTQGRSKEEAIADFLRGVDWKDLVEDIADAVVSMIAISVY